MTEHTSRAGQRPRPFSVIPQSLRDAAALQAEMRRSECVAFDDERSTCDECESYVEGDGAAAERRCASVPLDRYGIPEDATLDERLAYVQRMLEREAAGRVRARHPREKSPLHGVLQDFVDGLFQDDLAKKIKRFDVVVAADSADLPQDLMEIVELLPPGSYTRQRLCSQLNSAIGAHAWSHKYGMVR